MALNVHVVPGDRVRIPDQRAGTATVISRYRKERAVLIHPDDFHRLQALEAFISAVIATESLEFSDTAIAAHRSEETPGAPITDPAQLAELFG
ncbi:MAG: hypothetical protein ACRDPC_12680 [Solirubrobacteraceae bacterium]